MRKSSADILENLILKGGSEILEKTRSILVEVDEKYVSQSEKINKYLVEAGLKLKEKKQSDLIKWSKFKSVFNQIWERN